MKRGRLLPLTLLLLGALTALAWAASARWGFFYQHRLSAQESGPDCQTGVSQGAFYFTYHPSRHFGVDQHWTFGPMSGRFRWWFKVWDAGPPRFNTGHRTTVVPLWAVALIFLGPGATLALRNWRRSRGIHRCPACGYSLAGLPAGSPCPECGGKEALAERRA